MKLRERNARLFHVVQFPHSVQEYFTPHRSKRKAALIERGLKYYKPLLNMSGEAYREGCSFAELAFHIYRSFVIVHDILC